MASLCDVNVLVALLHARHVHSVRAVAWLEQQAQQGSVFVCRMAQMGALRILTNRQWLKEEVMNAAEFWRGWEMLLSDDRFTMINEPDNLEMMWKKITKPFPKGQIAGTDTYFAAFATAIGHRLVTFDRGFRQYSQLDVDLLK
ncbi:MAG: PIN domain-containing protein [Nitrospinae bacterium]|nr:PIN domain-containing protein [Nitrospinota bacterium]